MRPGRRARSLSEGCRCVHGSKTDGRSAGRAEESPGPARPTTESPSAYRYSQSQATPARRPATGSSWPSINQFSHGCCQRRCVDRARDPHPNAGHKLNLDGTPTGRAHWCRRRLQFRGHHRRHEAVLLLDAIITLGTKRSSPSDQQRPRYAISPRRRRDLPGRLQALQDYLELLILGPTTTPARIHHFEPFDLGTALITVHKDSSQHRASLYKAAPAGCVPFNSAAGITTWPSLK